MIPIHHQGLHSRLLLSCHAIFRLSILQPENSGCCIRRIMLYKFLRICNLPVRCCKFCCFTVIPNSTVIESRCNVSICYIFPFLGTQEIRDNPSSICLKSALKQRRIRRALYLLHPTNKALELDRHTLFCTLIYALFFLLGQILLLCHKLTITNKL